MENPCKESDNSSREGFLEKYDIRCEICGERSITFDSWFNYQPCKSHSHLTPTEYNDLARKKRKDK